MPRTFDMSPTCHSANQKRTNIIALGQMTLGELLNYQKGLRVERGEGLLHTVQADLT